MYIDNGVVKIFLQKMIFTYSISSFKCPSSLSFFAPTVELFFVRQSKIFAEWRKKKG